MKFTLFLIPAVLILLPTIAQPKYESDAQITHVLNRLTFGPRPGDLEKVRSIGLEKFINGQLNPATLPQSSIVSKQSNAGASLRLPSSQLLAQYKMEKKQRKAAKRVNANASITKKSPDMKEVLGKTVPGSDTIAIRIRKARTRGNGKAQQIKRTVASQAIENKLVRAVESPRQLHELLSDFWFNHFNVCSNKGLDKVLFGVYEEQAIRPHVMGNFRDLLGATMHHPAMMFYLDNAQNTKAGFKTKNPKNKKRGINENYARELLELHTLGVDSGYTQHDVAELARVLTGWGMPSSRDEGSGYWASFEERRHDFGNKVIMGKTIRGTGANEIDQVLDMLAHHPSTARHISYKLVQFFVADKPPSSLVDKLSHDYLQSNGNIKVMLKTMIDSPEFWDSKYQGSKYKSPFHYMISAYRATGRHITQPKHLQQMLKVQGQPLYGCLTPDGYKNTKEAWLNADGLLKRIDFANSFAGGSQKNKSIDYRMVLSTINAGKLTEKTKRAIGRAPELQKVAALISSPEFMHY